MIKTLTSSIWEGKQLYKTKDKESTKWRIKYYMMKGISINLKEALNRYLMSNED